MNDVEKCAQPIYFVQLARQGRCQVEAKAIDMHFEDPIAQAVHDELQHARVAHVQAIARAGVVGVIALVGCAQPIVGSIINAAEGKRRTQLIAFRGVVVDHVQDDLDASGVQSLDHRLELIDRAGGGIARFGGEEADRVIAPVVPETLVNQVPVIDEVMNRHQFDGRDSQALQVLHDRSRGQPGIGSPQRCGNLRMPHGKALHVQLVDHTFVPGNPRRPIRAPGKCRIDDSALGHPGGAVTAIE